MRPPNVQPGRWPDRVASTRFASLIERENPKGCEIALLGMPDDTGVELNNGRRGAAEGPAAMRHALANLGVRELPSDLRWPRVFDAGDVVVVPGDLDETHRRVTEATAALVELGLFPIGIGGGHDLTYPFVRGVAGSDTGWHGVYFDPHLDVREKPGSGMPFRKLINNGIASSLEIHGFEKLANSESHTDWFRSHGGAIAADAEPQDLLTRAGDRPTFVSLDLDVIDQAFAPGVSALNPCGWTPGLTRSFVETAARIPGLRCFDIMELSPPNDRSGQTAKLAAYLLLSFLLAFAGCRQ